jgi:hypothetical protein
VCPCVCPNRELWPDRLSLEPDFLDFSISLYVTRGGAVRISSAKLDLEKIIKASKQLI